MPAYQLDDWIAVVEGRCAQPSPDYIVVTFPNEDIRDAYLSTVGQRPPEEIRAVLRTFLGGSRTVELSDRLHLMTLKVRQQLVGSGQAEVANEIVLTEYDRRVIRFYGGLSQTPTWEGVTWVIDLLPHFPHQALEAVHAYLLAHAQVLPDLRISGLTDAADVIRARYITQGTVTTEDLQQVLLELTSRDFEFLVAHLYRELGFEVVVTPAQKDGGKDVIARKPNEVIYIECKNWRGRVDSDVVAGLVGRVEAHRVTRGIVIGTSGFTRGPASAAAVAAESPARIALITGSDLITLLNETLGSEWHRRLERILTRERVAQARGVVPS